MSLFLWIGKLSPRSWGRLPVCQRRMQFMCVGLLLSLTERFVYGSDAFFFIFFFLLKAFASPTLHMSTNFCSWCKCDWLHSALLFLLLCLWNVLSILHQYLHPRCSCHFYFQNLWFFGRNPLDGQILQCPHDEGRLLLSIASNLQYIMYFTIQVIQRCKRRCSTSSRLSFSFGSLQNSDVHERDLESCLQHHRRESLRQDVKLHDESASPPASESRRSRILQPRKADGVL